MKANNNNKNLYDNFLKDRIFDNISITKKGKKISDKDFHILKMNEYELLRVNEYKISHLKELCNSYHIKKSGNKNELINRIYNYLKYSLYAIVVQKYIRGFLLRKYVKMAGPAFKNRSICINESDFASLDSLNEIPYNQFYSFTDNEKNVYGCNIISLYELVCKKTKYDIQQNKLPLNPYNREPFNIEFLSNFSHYLRLANLNNIEHVIIEKEEIIEPEQKLQLKIIDIFQYINELGNYSDSKWFSNLSRTSLVVFLRELYDIWYHRSQLSQNVMREIIPPHGNPFIESDLHIAQRLPDYILKKNAINIIERLTKSANTIDMRALGAYYVLTGLTLVSEDARNALPWLFQSVSHN